MCRLQVIISQLIKCIDILDLSAIGVQNDEEGQSKLDQEDEEALLEIGGNLGIGQGVFPFVLVCKGEKGRRIHVWEVLATKFGVVSFADERESSFSDVVGVAASSSESGVSPQSEVFVLLSFLMRLQSIGLDKRLINLELFLLGSHTISH